MTLVHIIATAGKLALSYVLILGLLMLTFVLLDQFEDWYQAFKESRKNKAAKAAALRASKNEP